MRRGNNHSVAMKTPESLQQSMDGCIRSAKALNERIWRDLEAIRMGADPKKFLPRLRKNSAEMEQRVHEFSAYSNALHTV